jgi:hypothetical protein
MSDWAFVASAGIAATSALLGAGIGYVTSRHQSAVELRKVEADYERLQLTHSEEHLRRRQALYQDFLDSAHRFHQSNSLEPWRSPDEMAEWAREFEHRFVSVSLFGTEAAREGATRLANAVYAAVDDVEYDGLIEDEFMASWAACIDAMRLDTAPG